MALKKPPAPWKRLPNESSKAFEAFTEYRDMGAERSYAKVGQELGKSKSLIERWGREHCWAERIRAWEDNLAIVAKREAQKNVAEMQKTQIDESIMMQKLGTSRLYKVHENRETIAVRDAITLVIKGAELERLARGEATARTESTIIGAISVSPLKDMTPDELRQLITATEGADDAED